MPVSGSPCRGVEAWLAMLVKPTAHMWLYQMLLVRPDETAAKSRPLAGKHGLENDDERHASSMRRALSFWCWCIWPYQVLILECGPEVDRNCLAEMGEITAHLRGAQCSRYDCCH
jgi:hypothetical protein